jgi:hypothetical protein
MEDKTELLVQIAPPPPHPHISTAEPDDIVTWPQDLIHLYSVYGQGSFDIFLFIFARTDENSNLTSTVETHLFLEILEQVASYDDSVIPLLKAIRSVEAWAVWGGTDNGDRCLWLAPTGDLPERVICVDSKCTEWSFYEMSVTSFLYGLLTRTIDCPMFTGDVFPTRYADMQGVSRILGRTMSTTEHFFLTPEDSVKIYNNIDDIGPEWRSV